MLQLVSHHTMYADKAGGLGCTSHFVPHGTQKKCSHDCRCRVRRLAQRAVSCRRCRWRCISARSRTGVTFWSRACARLPALAAAASSTCTFGAPFARSRCKKKGRALSGCVWPVTCDMHVGWGSSLGEDALVPKNGDTQQLQACSGVPGAEPDCTPCGPVTGCLWGA